MQSHELPLFVERMIQEFDIFDRIVFPSAETFVVLQERINSELHLFQVLPESFDKYMHPELTDATIVEPFSDIDIENHFLFPSVVCEVQLLPLSFDRYILPLNSIAPQVEPSLDMDTPYQFFSPKFSFLFQVFPLSMDVYMNPLTVEAIILEPSPDDAMYSHCCLFVDVCSVHVLPLSVEV